MDPQEREWLCGHLSHNINVHDEYYRLPSNAVELAKISKLLIITERGEVHKHQGKTISELNLDDVNIVENTDQQPDDGADDESAEVHEDSEESDNFDEDEGL